MQTIDVNLDSLDLSYARLRSVRPSQERRIFISLEANGQQSPIQVVPDGKGGYSVIDGYKRVKALKRLKADIVLAMVWPAPVSQALVCAYQMNAGSGMNALEEGWLIEELHRVFHLSLQAIASGMDKSKSWVSRRLGLVERLAQGVQELVRKGKLGAYAAVTWLLPLSRDNAKECERLAKKMSEMDLTSREMADICQSYQKAGPDIRGKIIENPALFLKAKQALGADAALGNEENRCLKNLVLIGNVSLGLARLLPETLGSDRDDEARRKITAAWQRCRERFEMLAKTADAVMTQSAGRLGAG